MKIKVLILAIALNSVATSAWAQQPDFNANLLAQLETRLTESETNSKRLTGAPKLLWLLRRAKIEKIIGRTKAGQSVDPKEIDVVLKGQIY